MQESNKKFMLRMRREKTPTFSVADIRRGTEILKQEALDRIYRAAGGGSKTSR